MSFGEDLGKYARELWDDGMRRTRELRDKLERYKEQAESWDDEKLKSKILSETDQYKKAAYAKVWQERH